METLGDELAPCTTLATNSAPVATLQITMSTFRLYDLPLELRRFIFRHTLATCGSTILRTSRQVNSDAIEYTYSSALLRVNLHDAVRDVNHYIGSPFLSLQYLRNAPLASIQKIAITVDYAKLNAEMAIRVTKFLFLIPHRGFHRPKTCMIEIINCNVASVKPKIRELLCLFKTIHKVNNVFLTVYSGVGQFQMCSGVNPYFNPDQGPHRLVNRAWNKEVYDIAEREWAMLGLAVWNDGDRQQDRYLEFHPREHRNAVRCQI